MPFDTLTKQQQTFISKYFKKGFFKKSKNKKIVARYEEYIPLEREFLQITGTLPKDDPRFNPLIAKSAAPNKLKNDGKFKEAGAAMHPLIDEARDIQTELTQARAPLVQELAGLGDPASANSSEKAAMKVDRDAAVAALAKSGERLPSPAKLKTARDAIARLRKQIDVFRQLDKLATASPQAAAKTLETLRGFDTVLGGLDITPQVMEDSKNAHNDAVKIELAKAKALKAARKLPKGNPQEIAARNLAMEQARTALQQARTAVATARERKTAILGKVMLTEAVTVGPLSPDTGRPLSDTAAEQMVVAFGRDPELTGTALELAQKSDNPDVIAAQMGKMCDRIEDGFASSTGRHWTSEAPAREYAERLLKAGDAQGGTYFADLDAYVASGRQFKSKVFGPTPGKFNELATQRSQALGAAMLDTDGKLDPNSAAAKQAFDDLRFNNDILRNDTPSLTKHIGQSIAVLKDPVEGPKCAAVINAVKAPTGTTAKGIVAGALGKDPTTATLTDADTQMAVMGAFMAPMDQGPVGSCFTTAPARRFRDENPSGALAGLAEVATKATFTSASGRKVPATTKLHDGQDAVLRGWEYSIASAAATEAGSRERNRLRNNLFTADGLGAVKDIVGDPAWALDRGKLQTAVGDSFLFTYDPTSKIVDSSDGSSSTGRYQLIEADEFGGPVGDPITTKAKFIEVMTRVALDALNLKDTDPKGVEITNLVKSSSFIDAVCPGKYKPWEMPSGGMELGPTKALYGGSPTTTETLGRAGGPPPPNEGARTKDVLVAVIGGLGGSTDQYVNIGTDGIHSFNALPTDPGMLALIGTNPTETAQKVEAALVIPGRDIADKTLPLERAIYLYDKQMNAAVAAESDPTLKSELQTAVDANRPTTDLKPEGISSAAKAAMTAYNKKKAKVKADAWKQKKITDGETVTTEAYDKELAEWEGIYDDRTSDAAASQMIIDLGCPQVKMADTNWGDERTHTFFVVAPDPSTGELRLWKKTEPDGTFRAEKRKWIDTKWDVTA